VTGTTTFSDTFANNNNSWSLADGASISGGYLNLPNQSASRATYSGFGGSTGDKFLFEYTVTGNTNGQTWQIDDDGAGAGVGGVTSYTSVTHNTNGTFSFIFTRTASNRIRFLRTIFTNVTAVQIDSITIKPLQEPDRSVNNNGLAVYGTITKTAVATGSNLVSYGGFSTTTNYLQQPFNSSLTFGTNDFSVMCWYYNNSSTEIRVQRNTSGADGWAITLGNAAGDFYIHNGNFSTFAAFNGISNTGVWNHWTIVRKYNDKWYVYKNGILAGTTTTLVSTNFNDSGVFLINAPSGASTNSISLVRVSSTVPSPTQIAKIYNDEKALFQPNSQCTLFGSSDAVTALAYDDTTRLLSVGTSSGRSDFQGLERINNTTTAVTTAISASNGLIAEQ
jgi:hypothetical protein